MKRILLTAPRFDSEFAMAREFSNLQVQRTMTDQLMVPLHLATVAALTPDDFEVDIWDEGSKGDITEETDVGKDYDLVGVTSYIAQVPRALKIAEIFRKRGVTVVMGGPGVSGSPEKCRGAFDVLFLGEAELTWPRFLREWTRGRHSNEYRQVERPNLSCSPIPRWASIAGDIPSYRLAGVQTTRGCPFDCDFCDVIHLFGRQPRHKPIENVIQEVTNLVDLGHNRVFFCDDDFSGDKKYAKQLLRELIPVNNSFKLPCTYLTQLTIDVARDDELLALMADCNFNQVFIGIETPRAASLSEANKYQNLRTDLVADCRKVQSYGIVIKAGMMVGFDNDDKAIFDEQIKFIEEAQIVLTSINTIKAYPGTPLWVRLQQQDRVVDVSDFYDDAPRVVSNVIPKQMTLVELLEGYQYLLKHIRSWDSFKKRIFGYIDGIARRPAVAPISEDARRERMQNAKGFINSLNEDVRKPVTEIITYTLQKAPYLMEKVGAAMMQHFLDFTLFKYHSEVAQKEIDLSRAGLLKPDKDPSAGLIPANFQGAVKPAMLKIHKRLVSELEYKTALPEAFVGILKDFLIRWGPTFQSLEDFHGVYMQELCDRHIERLNRKYADGHGSPDENTIKLSESDAQSARFIREVLAAVEQEMRGDVRTKQYQELITLSLPALEREQKMAG